MKTEQFARVEPADVRFMRVSLGRGATGTCAALGWRGARRELESSSRPFGVESRIAMVAWSALGPRLARAGDPTRHATRDETGAARTGRRGRPAPPALGTARHGAAARRRAALSAVRRVDTRVRSTGPRVRARARCSCSGWDHPALGLHRMRGAKRPPRYITREGQDPYRHMSFTVICS